VTTGRSLAYLRGRRWRRHAAFPIWHGLQIFAFVFVISVLSICLGKNFISSTLLEKGYPLCGRGRLRFVCIILWCLGTQPNRRQRCENCCPSSNRQGSPFCSLPIPSMFTHRVFGQLPGIEVLFRMIAVRYHEETFAFASYASITCYQPRLVGKTFVIPNSGFALEVILVIYIRSATCALKLHFCPNYSTHDCPAAFHG
jgi:hypothetical protein